MIWASRGHHLLPIFKPLQHCVSLAILHSLVINILSLKLLPVYGPLWVAIHWFDESWATSWSGSIWRCQSNNQYRSHRQLLGKLTFHHRWHHVINSQKGTIIRKSWDDTFLLQNTFKIYIFLFLASPHSASRTETQIGPTAFLEKSCITLRQTRATSTTTGRGRTQKTRPAVMNLDMGTRHPGEA